MKIRQAFVANSSSSSFLIIGKFFNTEEEAETFSANLGKDSTFRFKEYNGQYIAGFDIDPGMAEGVSGNVGDLITGINGKYTRLKDIMKDEPVKYYGYTGYDG